MDTHVEFIGVLFIVWGALTALVGFSMLALGVGAAALITSTSGSREQVAVGLTAVMFVTLAIIAVVWGVGHILIGLPLRRRRPRARLLALMVGSVDLLLLPYGTALGCYALWVLLTEQGKQLFEIAD